MSQTKTELLKAVLGNKVKFSANTTYGYREMLGKVIGVYIEHPCQQKELKIFSEELGGSNKYVYKKLSEVTPVKTITAYAYKDNNGDYMWASYEDGGSFERVPSLDMTKEI